MSSRQHRFVHALGIACTESPLTRRTGHASFGRGIGPSHRVLGTFLAPTSPLFVLVLAGRTRNTTLHAGKGSIRAHRTGHTRGRFRRIMGTRRTRIARAIGCHIVTLGALFTPERANGSLVRWTAITRTLAGTRGHQARRTGQTQR